MPKNANTAKEAGFGGGALAPKGWKRERAEKKRKNKISPPLTLWRALVSYFCARLRSAKDTNGANSQKVFFLRKRGVYKRKNSPPPDAKERAGGFFIFFEKKY